MEQRCASTEIGSAAKYFSRNYERRSVLLPSHSTSTELVYTREIAPGWNEDFTALWNEAMDEANLRE